MKIKGNLDEDEKVCCILSGDVEGTIKAMEVVVDIN